MKILRGDVVLVSYPFASGTEFKVRPALIVQCDANNRRLANTLVVQITTRTQFALTEPTQLFISADSLSGRQAGLLDDSAISCENIFTIRRDKIIRRIGSLPPEIMKMVNECLKASLEIR